VAAIGSPLHAEIYRYQDADGRWIFSDRPQLDQNRGQDRSDPPSTPEPIASESDLAERLQQRYRPASGVEASSLAVVKVKSAVGSGSGFFVSADGLLLTNRHVVKPPRDWAREQEQHLEVVKAQIEDLEQKLAELRERYADSPQYQRGQRILRQRNLEYRQAKRELEMKRYATQLQTAFEIELKDGTVLAADLVDVSSNHDLALLQVKGHRTPYIEPALDRQLRQTDTVYAIGSPLGITDTITAGTYTSQRGGLLVTDARIMPGNSGGPMVDKDGRAVGINTLKATEHKDPTARGFGLAIPIGIAFAEFQQLAR
jgi:S1-C subfamily serine protease